VNKSRAIQIYQEVWVFGNPLTQDQLNEINEASEDANLSNLAKVLNLTGFLTDSDSIPEEFLIHVARDKKFLEGNTQSAFTELPKQKEKEDKMDMFFRLTNRMRR
jgi:predicted house-cleaning noncanonical NTP pyrophosphatase (MazG superfamily)